MLMIVMLHTQSKTGWIKEVSVFSITGVISWGLHALCMVAVNCYVLISGYFLSDSTSSFRKLAVLWKEIIFWSIILYVACLFVTDFSPLEAIMALFPVSTREYWFVTVYFALYLLSPYINTFLKHIGQTYHLRLVLLLVFLFSLLPSILPFPGDDGNIGLAGIGGTNLCWFITLYVIAAYLRYYGDEIRWKLTKYGYLLMYVCVGLLVLASNLIFSFSEELFGFGGSCASYFYNYASIFMLVMSVSLFLFFEKSTLELPNKVENIVFSLSKLTFGVYLIHEHPSVRKVIWPFVIRITDTYFEKVPYILIFLGWSSLIFFGCLLLSFVRYLAFELFDKLRNKKESSRIVTYIDRTFWGPKGEERHENRS